jgi:hypothetical protein
MTFTTGFLELGAGVLFDTHFTERGRLGRLVSMVGRLHAEDGRDLLGVGVDDRTALCVYPDRTAEVIGEGAVTFVHRTAGSVEAFEPGEAPAFTQVAHTQLTEGYRYDLGARAVLARPAGAVLVPPPVGSPDFAGGVLARGSSLPDAGLGEVVVQDGGSSSALFDGALTLAPGSAALARTVVSPRPWLSTTWDENRVGGPQWALHLNPHFLALYLALGSVVETDAARRLRVRASETTPAASVVLLDSHGIVSTAASAYTSGASSAGPRQSVALEGAALHVLPPGWAFDALAHAPVTGLAYGEGKVNSTGARTELAPWGSPLSGSSFELRVRRGVPGRPALLFRGAAANQAPLVGGTLYVAPPIAREALTTLDSDGAARFPLPHDPLLVGATRWYQVWHRDPGAADGTGVGLSNGVEVSFGG